MDPNTGRIYQVEDEAEARRRGLVPIPREQEPAVRGMNRRERRAWAAQQRKKERPGA